MCSRSGRCGGILQPDLGFHLGAGLAFVLGERVHRRGLLQTGSVMRLKDALSAAD